MFRANEDSAPNVGILEPSTFGNGLRRVSALPYGAVVVYAYGLYGLYGLWLSACADLGKGWLRREYILHGDIHMP